MIKIEYTEVNGWEAAIRGMRNPMNSWDKSSTTLSPNRNPVLCEADRELMRGLAKAGDSHSKYLRMITVTMDVTAPLYWWKEFDTYKVGTVANSCSTMHSIHKEPFSIGDFSAEHLHISSRRTMDALIEALNQWRELFLESENKFYWWQMIQLLPSSYNQRRTIQLNYSVLRRMYHERKNHKLDEWREFCAWIKTLPCATDLLVGEREAADEKTNDP